MLIDSVYPHVVGARSSLQERLAAEGRALGLAPEIVEELIAIVPLKLLNTDCFMDRSTDIWRYEYGRPRNVAGDQLLWGTYMWNPVRVLLRVLRSVHARLPERPRRRYLERLSDLEKHADVLAEFLPAVRLPEGIAADFQHPTGAGNRDVEWRIRPAGRQPVLIEVKNRMLDIFETVERINAGERDPGGTAPAPIHDVAMLFRSVETKFMSFDPDEQLQGVWIATDLQQEQRELTAAFAALDGTRVHYAILGDWDPGVTILTRREPDRLFLLDLFSEVSSERFVFQRARPNSSVG